MRSTREAKNSPSQRGDGYGGAVELHYPAEARHEVQVGQVQRRGGYERLVVVRGDERERGEGRYGPGGEQAPEKAAERADDEREEELRGQRLRRAAKGVNRRLRYALLLDYGGRKREYQRENKARRGGEQREIVPQPPRRNAW